LHPEPYWWKHSPEISPWHRVFLTTNTSATAITLNADKNTAIAALTGGNIIVTGSPTITTGSGGIARLFSGSDPNSPGLTALAGGSANVRIFADETTSTFSPVLSANNVYAIYRVALGPAT
jgi:hypothetical protein